MEAWQNVPTSGGLLYMPSKWSKLRFIREIVFTLFILKLDDKVTSQREPAIVSPDNEAITSGSCGGYRFLLQGNNNAINYFNTAADKFKTPQTAKPYFLVTKMEHSAKSIITIRSINMEVIKTSVFLKLLGSSSEIHYCKQ
ncbi:hypothetical protein CapIbe_021747 [Capra ibex]